MTALANDVPLSTGSVGNAYYSFNQTDLYWTAVAVRNTAVDWDIFASQDNVVSPAPACATLPLTSSGWCHRCRTSSSGTSTTTRSAPITFVPTSSPPEGSIPRRSNGIRAWTRSTRTTTTSLAARRGRTTSSAAGTCNWWLASRTRFDLNHVGGADLKLLLFRNTGGGTYWAPAPRPSSRRPPRRCTTHRAPASTASWW